MELKNPLTIEERWQLLKLLEHDCMNELGSILAHAENASKVRDIDFNDLGRRARKTIPVINTLVRIGLNNVIHSVGVDLFDKEESYDGLFGFLKENYPELKICCGEFKNFTTQKDLLELVLINLVRNAFEYDKHGKDVKLFINSSGFPEHALYIPEQARNYREFLEFSIENSGEFSRERPLIERLTISPPFQSRGFGLYFTGLAAKVLQGCVDIQSQPGDTTVSFYHPIYEEARR